MSFRVVGEVRITELYNRYADSLKLHIRRIVRDDDATEDLLQELFFRVWTTRATWNATGSIEAWLTRSASNLAFNYLRRVRRRRETPLAGATADDDEAIDYLPRELEATTHKPESLVESRQFVSLVRDLINALPEGKREAVRLVHLNEMSIHDAAKQLGVPPGTVKSRLYYGREAIEGALRDFIEE